MVRYCQDHKNLEVAWIVGLLHKDQRGWTVLHQAGEPDWSGWLTETSAWSLLGGISPLPHSALAVCLAPFQSLCFSAYMRTWTFLIGLISLSLSLVGCQTSWQMWFGFFYLFRMWTYRVFMSLSRTSNSSASRFSAGQKSGFQTCILAGKLYGSWHGLGRTWSRSNA